MDSGIDKSVIETTVEVSSATGYDYDLLVIGSGPAGQRAAIQAAKLGKRAAVVEKKQVVGGVCINTGTIPSKTLREAALHLSGYRERSIYGSSYAVKRDITMADLLYRAGHVIRNEIDVTNHQLRRNGVEVLPAEGAFVGPNTVRLNYTDGRGQHDITAEHVAISVRDQDNTSGRCAVRRSTHFHQRRHPGTGNVAAEFDRHRSRRYRNGVRDDFFGTRCPRHVD